MSLNRKRKSYPEIKKKKKDFTLEITGSRNQYQESQMYERLCEGSCLQEFSRDDEKVSDSDELLSKIPGRCACPLHVEYKTCSSVFLIVGSS